MNTTTKTPLTGELEDHPIAGIFPLMDAAALAELTDSHKRNGQREVIVLHEGKILDGRNRYRAGRAADVPMFTREFGSEETDGDSPVRFVLDLNLERRHLTVGQRAAVATDALPFFEAEATARQSAAAAGAPLPGTPGNASDQAGAKLGVSGKSVRRAKKLAKKSPGQFAAVKRGDKSLNKAEEDARKEGAAGQVDEALEKLRRDNGEAVRKALGDSFGDAFDNGVVLKTADDMKDFLTLDSTGWKPIMPLVQRGWTVKQSLKFNNKAVKRSDKVSDLFLRTLVGGKRKGVFLIDGHEVTVKMNIASGAAEE